MLSCPGLLFSEAASTQPPDSPLLTLALPNSHLHLHLHLATDPRAISQHHHSRTQHQLTFLPRAFSPRPPSPSPAVSSRCSSRQPSPSRFWPASSLRRPISPLIPQSSVLLFEVRFLPSSEICQKSSNLLYSGQWCQAEFNTCNTLCGKTTDSNTCDPVSTLFFLYSSHQSVQTANCAAIEHSQLHLYLHKRLCSRPPVLYPDNANLHLRRELQSLQCRSRQ
jgi:hypothetical protein